MNKTIFLNYIRPILFFLGSIILVKLLGSSELFTDELYPKINGFLGKMFYLLSARFSFSLGDIFYLILILLGIIFFANLIFRLLKKRYTEVNVSIRRLIYFLAGFYLYFHLVWGFNYYKTPINESYDVELNSLNELKVLAEIYFLKTMAYRTQVEEDENGVFKMSISKDEINRLIDQSSEKISIKYPELRLSAQVGANIKSSLFSEVFSHLGVSGYYNPFTNEGQYNALMADSNLLFTQLHETAHQWGFATEDEANFVGFLLGISSDHHDLLYVSNYRAMRSILNRIYWYDPLFVKNYVENRYSEAMKRDRAYEIEIAMKYSGKTEEAFSFMNEAFLKLNNQEGLESYGRFVELLVGYNRMYAIKD